MIRRIARVAFSAAVATVFVAGIATLFTPAQARFGGGNCICPDVYAPVICSNGVTYSNSCVASCNHATDCHLTGDI
jgi:hypothetical protein